MSTSHSIWSNYCGASALPPQSGCLHRIHPLRQERISGTCCASRLLCLAKISHDWPRDPMIYRLGVRGRVTHLLLVRLSCVLGVDERHLKPDDSQYTCSLCGPHPSSAAIRKVTT